MKIYDISQELFGCVVFPGDPAPVRQTLSSMEEGALYNLTALSLCAHNGTHIDAPYHFIKDGKTVDKVPLSKTVGWAYVAQEEGMLSAKDAHRILADAQMAHPEAAKRILVGGKVTITEEAALVFAEAGINLLGNESQTIGPEDAPMQVHLILLSREVVLLEGIRLSDVPTGVYLLSAAPISLAGSDGAPCRAILISFE
ncbi:MAG: cyclase family protein [Clostridia bacterium]|nr:cyclase family protein [Clostridia bacterium]